MKQDVKRPKVGLMTFGDQRQDMWEKLFGPLTIPRHKEAIEYLETLPVDLKAFKEVARSRDEIDSQINQLAAEGVEVFIAHIPCWTSPNLVARGVQRIKLPTALITSKSPATHGTVGLLGAAGTLDQIGLFHIRIEVVGFGFDLGNPLEPVIEFAPVLFQQAQGTVVIAKNGCIDTLLLTEIKGLEDLIVRQILH